MDKIPALDTDEIAQSKCKKKRKSKSGLKTKSKKTKSTTNSEPEGDKRKSEEKSSLKSPTWEDVTTKEARSSSNSNMEKIAKENDKIRRSKKAIERYTNQTPMIDDQDDTEKVDSKPISELRDDKSEDQKKMCFQKCYCCRR